MPLLYRFFLTCLFFTLAHATARAHPHSWIDLETSLIFNDQGQVIGLWQGWLFDDFYSAFTLEGMAPDKNGKYDQKALNSLAETNLKNLSEYSYFTFIHKDGKQPAYHPVHDYKTFVENNRLWMEFSVMLTEPIDPKAHKIDYAVYDPTYYVEILHAATGDPVQLSGKGALGCSYRLKNPEPPKEMSLMAAAMDKSESAGDGIGIYFAQHVEISCP